MSDPLEYGFGDWYRLFLKAFPAFLLAGLMVSAPIIALLALVWFLIPIAP